MTARAFVSKRQKTEQKRSPRKNRREGTNANSGSITGFLLRKIGKLNTVRCEEFKKSGKNPLTKNEASRKGATRNETTSHLRSYLGNVAALEEEGFECINMKR